MLDAAMALAMTAVDLLCNPDDLITAKQELMAVQKNKV